MLMKLRGFTLAETLIAMLLSSLLLLTTMRLLPELQRLILHQATTRALHQNLWQLAFTIGKQLQRAGYCQDLCAGKGLYLDAGGHCLIVSWQAGHTPEYTGYRLRDGSIEIRRNVSHCQQQGWEKITDPTGLHITQFQVKLQPRVRQPPLLHIVISSRVPGTRQNVTLQHSVVGYNL